MRGVWRGIDKRQQAFDAVSLSRREGISLSQAAERVGTTSRTVRRHVPGAVEKRGGRFYARRYDRVRRDSMRVLVKGGEEVWIGPYSSANASLIGRQHNAIGRYLNGRTEQQVLDAESDLERLEGRIVVGYDPGTGERVRYELETNIEVVDRLARVGGLKPESIYKESK